MKFRIAKNSDIKMLSELHFEAGKIQPNGYMYKLGLPFLKIYYKLLVNEKNSLVIVAENKDSIICGFCAGTFVAEEHIKTLKKSRLKIAISLIPSIIKSPQLILSILARNRFINSNGKSSDISISSGPRFEYWAWSSKNKNPFMAINLLKFWLKIMFNFGVNSVKAEVDIANSDILKLHQKLGAHIIKEITLSDGRKRVHIEYTNHE